MPKKCPVCGMKRQKGFGVEAEGKWFCSEEHMKQAAQKCSVCQMPFKAGTGVTKNGAWFCSEEHAGQKKVNNQKKNNQKPVVVEY